MRFDDSALAPYQGQEPYIFLSYSHLDGEQAAEIIRGMNANGFRVWYDEGLVPGKEWDENIARTIMRCSYFTALMSRNYLDSANCRDELNFARDKKLPLLLIYLEDIELPAGMEMRLGRMLAIHENKYSNKKKLFDKIKTADGISLCRDIPEGEEPVGAFVPEETVRPQMEKKSGSGAKRFVLPAVIVAALALAAIFLLPGKKKNDPPVVSTPPTEVAATQAPETQQPVPTAEVKPEQVPETTPESAPTAEPAPEQTEQELAYQAAAALRDAGNTAPAALAFYRLGDYKDAAEQSQALWRSVQRGTISMNKEHSIGLKEDGSVYVAGNLKKEKADIFGWGNLIAVAAGTEHSLGLKADGTVVSKGVNAHGERSLSAWKDIIAIAAGNEVSVGLCADGTVVARGNNGAGQCNVEQWTDIVAIAVGEQHTVGLRADGSVETTGYNNNGQRNVEDWTDIVAVAAGSYHTLGLKADGTVVATGYNAYGQCDVSGWTDIVAIAAGKRHSVGLKADGTVVAVGSNAIGQCNVSDWQNVIEIACGESGTMALISDGTAVADGSNGLGQCNVGDWKDLRLPAR